MEEAASAATAQVGFSLLAFFMLTVISEPQKESRE